MTFAVAAFVAVYYPYNNIRLSEDDINTVVQNLREKNITIDADVIPRNVKSMSMAVMSGEFEAPGDIADILLPDGYSERLGECYTDNILIKFDPGISIKCNPAAFPNEFKNVYSGNVVKKIRSILEDYIPEPGDIIMEIYEGGNNRLNVLVTRTYKNYPIFNDSLLFGVSGSGISSVTGLWYAVEKDINQKHLPKSPVHALMAFAADKNNYGTNVVSITVGYRLNTDAQNAKGIELIPTWRILTDKGEIHYIDS